MIKRIVGYIGTYSLFWLGQIAGIFMNSTNGWSYDQYNWLMGASVKVQDWAGLDSPWKKVDDGK